MKRFIISLSACACTFALQAQRISVSDAVALAIRNNPGISAEANNVEAKRQLKQTGVELPKTDITFMRGQYNSYAKDDNNITIVQSIPFTALGSQASLNRATLAAAELKKTQSENELIYRVRQAYYQLSYLKARRKLLLQQDSLFEGFYKAASLRYKTGETTLLEQTTAASQRNESKNAIFQAESDILALREQLRSLLNSVDLPDTDSDDLVALMFSHPMDSLVAESNPALALSRQQVEVAETERKVASAKFAPDLLVGYFNQTLIGTVNPASGEIASRSNRFSGFQVGLAIPLWFAPYQARVKAAKYTAASAQNEYENQRLQVNAHFQQAIREYEKNKVSLEYYRNTGLPTAALIISQSKTAFRQGELGYAEYLLGIRNAIAIQEKHLLTLDNFNQTILYLEFLTGNK